MVLSGLHRTFHFSISQLHRKVYRIFEPYPGLEPPLTRQGRFRCNSATAAVVVAAAIAVAAITVVVAEEDQQQNDDPPPVVTAKAADTIGITVHRNDLLKEIGAAAPFIPMICGRSDLVTGFNAFYANSADTG